MFAQQQPSNGSQQNAGLSSIRNVKPVILEGLSALYYSLCHTRRRFRFIYQINKTSNNTFPRLKFNPPIELKKYFTFANDMRKSDSTRLFNLASCWIENSKHWRCAWKMFNWTTGRCYANSKYLNFKYLLYLQICTLRLLLWAQGFSKTEDTRNFVACCVK